MTAHQMLAKVRNLPSLSPAAIALGAMLGRPEVSNEEVVHVLKEDSVLTAKLLRACNSPALALQEPVASVDQAVFLLGHAQISRMVTTIAFRNSLSLPLPAYGLAGDDLWRHSILAASAAQMLATDCRALQIDPSLAFTAGLLHDIGKLVTNSFLSRDASISIHKRLAAGGSVIEAEREILGTDHAEVGSSLLYLWRLPDVIIEAVACHHSPVVESRPRLSAIAWFANAAAHRTAAVVHQDPAYETALRMLESFGFNCERIASILSTASEPLFETGELVEASA